MACSTHSLHQKKSQCETHFLKKTSYILAKTQLLTQNGVKQRLQQRRCLAGNDSCKTRGYNKKWLSLAKRQFSTQNGVRTKFETQLNSDMM